MFFVMGVLADVRARSTVGTDSPIDGVLDTLNGMTVGGKILAATFSGGDGLADMNANVLAVVTTASEFNVSATFEDSALFCQPMAALGCARFLQTWMPSYHV